MEHLSESISRGSNTRKYRIIDKVDKNTTSNEFDRFLEENGITIDDSFDSIRTFTNTGTEFVGSGKAVKITAESALIYQGHPFINYYVFPKNVRILGDDSCFCLIFRDTR